MSLIPKSTRSYRAGLGLLAFLISVAFAVACASDGQETLARGRPCDPTRPCPLGQICRAGFCEGRQGPSSEIREGDTWALPAEVAQPPTDAVPSGDGERAGDVSSPHDSSPGDPSDISSVDPFDVSSADTFDLAPDAGVVDSRFCWGFTDCSGDLICELTEGRCERRATHGAGGLALYGFRPGAGAAGDQLVVDGSGFYSSLFGSMGVRVNIGPQALSGVADENRVIVSVPAGASGAVTVKGENGTTPASAVAFSTTAGGVLACDDTTPAAGFDGAAAPTDSGPFAAGYVDVPGRRLRIYYPAECGGVRRPPVAGEYPLVIFLHGNGAVYWSYEYLAASLATWGFVSAMPETGTGNEEDPQITRQIRDVVDDMRGVELSGLHEAVLAGLHTTQEAAFVGHSRGCGRMQDYFRDQPAVRDMTVATIFLGPHDNERDTAPGLFLVIGATEDHQSLVGRQTPMAYSRQPAPRWKVIVQGGNHSLFCDHKIYSMFDGEPSVTRRQQLGVVLSFSLPIMQRAFGHSEPFASWLDSPEPSPLYEVEFER